LPTKEDANVLTVEKLKDINGNTSTVIIVSALVVVRCVITTLLDAFVITVVQICTIGSKTKVDASVLAVEKLKNTSGVMAMEMAGVLGVVMTYLGK
jgi:hypothetical protein